MRKNNGLKLLYASPSILALGFVLLQCKHYPVDQTPIPSDLSFYRDVLPITQNRCIACHNQNTPGRNWMVYEDALVNRKAIAMRILNFTMPPAGFEIEERERRILMEWVRQGSQP